VKRSSRDADVVAGGERQVSEYAPDRAAAGEDEEQLVSVGVHEVRWIVDGRLHRPDGDVVVEEERHARVDGRTGERVLPSPVVPAS